MTILQSTSKLDFINQVANFVIKHYRSDFSKLKVILPNGQTCSRLQQAIVQKLEICILPNIIPFDKITAEDEEVFQIPSSRITSISKLEEKIVLAEIIYEYTKLNYNQTQCLNLAPSLAGLFFELEANNVNIEHIKDLPSLDQPAHWYQIYDFLSFAFYAWQQKIQKLNKTTRAKHQEMMLSSELQRLKNNPLDSLIIAGIYGNNSITSNFINDAIKFDNCHLILPPYPAHSLTSSIDTALNQLIQLFNSRITLLDEKPYAESMLDQLVANSKTTKFDSDIQCVEFDHIFHEAEFIALKCQKTLEANPHSKIAIITHNQKTKEQYCTFLDKYHLKYQDQFGQNILQHKVVTLILFTAEQICCEFDLQRFFVFLSHPLMNSPKSWELKNIIRRKNRFAHTLQDITNILDIEHNQELSGYFNLIKQVISKAPTSHDFVHLFAHTLAAIEQIIPNIWQLSGQLVDSLREIYQLNQSFIVDKLEDFPEILQQTLNGGRIIHTTHDAPITITQGHNTILINYDLTIITDMNEGTYPKPLPVSAWINTSMQQKLNLIDQKTKADEDLYNFYLNLHNPHVLITRSKLDITNKHTLPSPFILNLQNILQDKLEIKTGKAILTTSPVKEVSQIAKSTKFPQQIYATDIETLIKSPYNFYSKKILKLRPIQEISDRPNLADFGNFIHSVIEQYSKDYRTTCLDKKSQLINIADSILTNSTLTDNNKKTWHTKVQAIADSFIDFDETRRQTSVKIYSEIEGKIDLNVKGQTITLKAIADRIEVNNLDVATIIDFKTGAAPTKQDVASGLAPQMIIEAIILAGGGFAINCNQVDTLSYIKIASTSPYIQNTSIPVTRNDIVKHREGLLDLLAHYSSSLEFPIEYNLMKYDDYTHLARRFGIN
ncbi:MAG: PD-(D/E)XK nuclease family protein [Rickettsiaceae bacterium]